MNGPERDHIVRGDIEGLRALAVISVLIGHAFPNALPGGFAGVDIFFVISGYLIGRHLLQDINRNSFDILAFYAKRARRIFPALSLVLACVWAMGGRVFSAPEFSDLGRQIVASAFFSNNILLWSESGYFDAAALEKPLLHLWSLGIEEQFYLLVPGLLWLGSRGSQASVRWVAWFGMLSLLATMILGGLDDSASFYLLHTRFWELAAGVILAQSELLTHADKVRSHTRDITVFAAATIFVCVVVLASGGQWDSEAAFRICGLLLACAIAVFILVCTWRQSLVRNVLIMSASLSGAYSVVGIILILVSVFVSGSTDWPGAQTLFPVIGTLMLLRATPKGVINKLLGRQPLPFIGGISYPLYLWHWPLIVFWKLLYPEANQIEMAIPLLLAALLAWLTKRFLEDPVRHGRLGLACFRRPNVISVVAGLILAATLGFLSFATQGFPSRIPANLQAIATWKDANPSAEWRSGVCYYPPQSATQFSEQCTPMKRPGVPLILLWGDSHAAQLYPGLAYLQLTKDFDIAQWTAGLCPPLLVPITHESNSCPARRTIAMGNLSRINPDVIVLAGAWELYAGNGQLERGVLQSLADTIRKLQTESHSEIIVFGPGPTWNTSLAIDLFRFMVAKHLTQIPERYGHAFENAWRLDAAMKAQASELGVRYVSVLSYFCNRSGCKTLGDQSAARPDLLFSDSNHLSVSGSRELIAHAALPLR